MLVHSWMSSALGDPAKHPSRGAVPTDFPPSSTRASFCSVFSPTFRTVRLFNFATLVTVHPGWAAWDTTPAPGYVLDSTHTEHFPPLQKVLLDISWLNNSSSSPKHHTTRFWVYKIPSSYYSLLPSGLLAFPPKSPRSSHLF